MNTEAKLRLAEVVRTARGSKSLREFGRLLGVAATTVQGWENGDYTPETYSLIKIAAMAGYSLEELLAHLDGKPVEQPNEVDRILKSISHLPLKQVALIGHAVTDRLASAVADSTSQYKAG